MSLRGALTALIQVPGLTVYDAGVPDDVRLADLPDRYAVLYAGAGLVTAGDVAFTPNLLTQSLQVTSVGTGAAEAEWVARQVRDALVGSRPSAAGWVTGPVVHVGSEIVRRDEDRPDRTVWFAVDRYDVMAARA